MKTMSIRKTGLYGIEQSARLSIDDKVIISIVNANTGEHIIIPFIGYVKLVSKDLRQSGELCIELIES